MKQEQNKAVAMRFIEEMWNQRRLEIADELFSTDCVTHQLRGPGSPDAALRSADLVKREATGWLTAFPDLKFDIEQMIAENDLVVSRCTMRGTQTGPWLGIAPTGKSVAVPMITIHRISHHRIVEDWVLVGTLAMFQQLGLVPETSEIIAKASKP